MAEFKLVIGAKDGKCVQREVKEAEAKALLGKRIGDKINGDDIGLAGYEFELTGGSDYCGFPMRKDVQGTGRKRILAVCGVGLKKKGKGIRQRKTVCGNKVHGKISQINLKILKEGKEKLGAAKPAEAKSEEAKPKAEEKKKEPKPEAKPKAEEKKKEPKPAAEPKEEEKKEEEKKKEPKPAAEPKEEEKKEEEKKEEAPAEDKPEEK